MWSSVALLKLCQVWWNDVQNYRSESHIILIYWNCVRCHHSLCLRFECMQLSWWYSLNNYILVCILLYCFKMYVKHCAMLMNVFFLIWFFHKNHIPRLKQSWIKENANMCLTISQDMFPVLLKRSTVGRRKKNKKICLSGVRFSPCRCCLNLQFYHFKSGSCFFSLIIQNLHYGTSPYESSDSVDGSADMEVMQWVSPQSGLFTVFTNIAQTLI